MLVAQWHRVPILGIGNTVRFDASFIKIPIDAIRDNEVSPEPVILQVEQLLDLLLGLLSLDDIEVSQADPASGAGQPDPELLPEALGSTGDDGSLVVHVKHLERLRSFS